MNLIHTLDAYTGFRKWINAKSGEQAFFESAGKGVGN